MLDYGEALARFLSADPTNRDRLSSLLREWQAVPAAPPRGGGSNFVEADLDGDGQAELLFAISQPPSDLRSAGMLFILRPSATGYSVAFSFPPKGENTAGFAGPVIEAVGDLNKDGRIEIVLSSGICGAECVRTIQVFEWDLGEYRSLIAVPEYLTDGRVSTADRDKDGTARLSLTGSLPRSVPQGLSRRETIVYGWRNGAYTPVDLTADPSPYLIFRVIDADAALARGDYRQAAELYRGALSEPSLALWLGERQGAAAGAQERVTLAAYSRFRRTLALFLAQDRIGADAAARDSALNDSGAPFGVATALFWAAAQSGGAAAGCAQVRRYLAETPSSLDLLNSYGIASPVFRPDSVCPVT